jgi:hypothetical protein
MTMTREERLSRLLATSESSQPARSARSASVDEEATPKAPKLGRFYAPNEAEELIEDLKPLDECVVGILEQKMIKGFAHEGDDSPQIVLNRLSDAIATMWDDDHHLQPLWSPKLTERLDGARRLTKAVFDVEESQVDVLVWDWDTPDHIEWTDKEFKEAVALATQHPMLSGAVFYRTRGGLRALRPLAKPFKVRGEGGADWSALYERLYSLLPTIQGQPFDPACSDAPRLFRAPWVRRRQSPNNPRRVTQTGLVYVPKHIEPYEMTYADLKVVNDALMPRIQKSDAIKGLVDVYRDIGWLGKESGTHNGHPKYHARCPWSELHTSGGDGSDDSCALLADEDGGYVVHCLHGSCKQNHKSVGVVRYLQTKHGEVWRTHCKVEQSQTVFDPYDYSGFLEQALDVLYRARKGEVFQRHQAIVSLEQAPTGEVMWREWNADYLTGMLNRSTRWVQEYTDKDGRTALKRTVVPKTIVQQSFDEIRSRLPYVEGRTVLPIIDPVTMAPTRLERGYCPDTHTYFLPSPSLDLDKLAEVARSKPTMDDAINAITEILDLYDDFPWQERAHKLLAVACTMTACLRRSIDGPAPLFLINANSKGVGKTKLIGAVIASVYGHSPVLSATPERPEELNKMLSSILLSDDDYLILDNVRGGIGDAQFDAFITSDSKKDRILGKSQMFSAKQRVFLGATGNNASLRADTDRRTIVTRLVTDLEHPEERKGFRHHDLISVARERVTETWCAVLTILRAFHLNTTAQERRQIGRDARNFGSFELWLDWVRDPLLWVGKEMYPEAESTDIVHISTKEVEEARGDDSSDLFSYLVEWQEHCDLKNRETESEWTASELSRALAYAQREGSGDYLEEFAGLFRNTGVRYVGKVLSGLREKVSQGHILTSRRSGKRGTLYSLKASHTPPENNDPTPTPPSPPTPPSDPLPPSEPMPPSDPMPPSTPEPSPVMQSEWATCDSAETHEIDPRAHTRFSSLTKRCAMYEGGLCRKENIECEFPDAHGGLGDAEARVLRGAYERELIQINEPPAPKPEAPPALDLESGESPILAVIRAELAIKKTRPQIAEALTERGIAPPVGKRKWTASTVSKIVKAHDLVPPREPKKPRNRVEEHIDKVGGTWTEYWPEAHPLNHTHLLDAPPLPDTESHHIVCDPNKLLAPIAGYAVTPQSALANRPQREDHT